MRYFKPELRLSTELPPQSSPEDKLGGVPWGLAPGAWPVCQECGRPLSLMAQFVHHPVRLDLGREGRLLSVFQCSHPEGTGCYTGLHGSGANACFVTEPEDLVAGLTPLPPGQPDIQREARIVAWHERDDGIDEEQADLFLSDDGLRSLPGSLRDHVPADTRLGGVPYWIQGLDEELLPDRWRFAGQLTDYYEFTQAPAVATDGFSLQDGDEGPTYVCNGPNYGTGIAYLFLQDTAGVPEGWFSWQC